MQRQHQLRHVEVTGAGNQFQRALRDHVDAHADMTRNHRFFLVVEEGSVVGEIDQSVVDLLLSFNDSHRRRCSYPAMRFEQIAERKIGQQITVHHQKVVRQVWYLAKRRGRSEWLELSNVFNGQAELAAIPEARREQCRHVSDRENDFGETVGGELPQHDLEHWHIAEREQRLGYRHGKGLKPRALSAGKYYCKHRFRMSRSLIMFTFAFARSSISTRLAVLAFAIHGSLLIARRICSANPR